MKTNDLKKGVRIKLRNGWYGTMMDNMRGATRLVKVEGFVTEIGSVYSRDIVAYQADGKWFTDIEHKANPKPRLFF